MGSFDMKEFVLWSFISRIGNCRITISWIKLNKSNLSWMSAAHLRKHLFITYCWVFFTFLIILYSLKVMEVDQNSSFRVESGLRAMERTSKTCRRYTKRTVNYRQSYLDAIIVVFHRDLKKKETSSSGCFWPLLSDFNHVSNFRHQYTILDTSALF